MTYKEAKEIKDKYEPIVIGKPFLTPEGKEVKKGYIITHVFIAPKADPIKTFKEWTKAVTLMSNEEAILRTSNMSVDLDVFILSYHSWADGNLYHRQLSKYTEQTGLKL